MKVRFNKWLGILTLVASPFFGGCFALIYFTDGFDFAGRILEFAFLVVFGALPILLLWGGINILIGRVYFHVDRNGLVLHAVVGPLKKTHPLQSLRDLKVEKNQVYLQREGKWQKLPIEYRSADREDWEAFLQFIQRPENIASDQARFPGSPQG